MVTNDATILRINHDVLYEVAKLAWNGELDEEHKDQVPYTIIPGPQAQFRCCIYKEREIIRPGRGQMPDQRQRFQKRGPGHWGSL